MSAPIIGNSRLQQRTRPQRLALAVLACAATTAVALPLYSYLDLANIVMLFLLTVLVVAVILGRDAAVFASALSVLLFDLFFVPPRFSLAVSNIQYMITFAVMLATALVTTHLTSGLKQKAEEALTREQATQALYTVARDMAGTLTVLHVNEIAQRFIATQLQAQAWIWISADHDTSLLIDREIAPFALETHLLKAVLQSDAAVHSQSPPASGYATLYLPLKTALRTRGALAVALLEQSLELTPPRRALLEAIASLAAIAIERLHFADVAQTTQLNMISERLRSSILSALSHDLRTPLTVLVGLADSLSLTEPPLPAAALEIAGAIHERTAYLVTLVANLLDMARLNAGNIALRREWQPLDEVIGASIKLLGSALVAHPVKVILPDDLPLLAFDAVLIERVFCNLLENAAKYAPINTTINITAHSEDGVVVVDVADHGSGFPAQHQTGVSDVDVFAMFERGRAESNTPGVGLGLAICRAIIEAHGGVIGLRNDAQGGCVYFTLPRGTPPIVEVEPI